MDRKKFFIFLILFEFIIISLFSNFNKVSAATTLEWKDLPDGCPTPTDVYNSLPDDQKSVVSVDKYAFYSLTYHRITNTEVQSWKRYSYIFISDTSHFADKEGWYNSDCDYVLCTFHDFNTSLSSEPDNWEFSSSILTGNDWTNVYHSISLDDYHILDYYFSTFNIYDGKAYSDEHIRFLQTPPPKISMGDIVLQNKDKVLKQVVLLLPIVLVTLVSLIGLKKALQMLMNFLRKS